MEKKAEIIVYGAEQLCASCVNLPSAKETYEWLQAAISRRYPDQPVIISYVDIFQPPEEEAKKEFAKRVVDEELFYPVVVIEGEIVGEGNPKLKVIYQQLEQRGYQSGQNN